MKRSDAGFSLLELLTVVMLIGIATTVAIIQMRQSVAMLDADKAANLVSAQIRYARQIAVDQRRNVEVAFVGSNQVTVTRQDGGGAETVLSDERLPAGYTFGLPTGIGSDTPEGYGNSQPVNFNLGTTGTFLGDGTLVNDAGIVMNGTVFTIGSGNGSARAITLTGASGRLKVYAIQGAAWIER